MNPDWTFVTKHREPVKDELTKREKDTSLFAVVMIILFAIFFIVSFFVNGASAETETIRVDNKTINCTRGPLGDVACF